MSQVTLKWVEAHLMVGTDSRGTSVVIGMSDQSSNTKGLKASDLLLLAAASCSMYDVVDILTKQRQPFRDIQVVCHGNQLKDPPYSFTDVHVHYVVYGDVEEEKVQRAIRLSQEKYCSVITTLVKAIPVTYDYEIIN